MGGNSGTSTVQSNANPLAALFSGSQGYQQQQMPVAPVSQPTYPAPAITPQQAAMATQARMQALNPGLPQALAKKPAVAGFDRGGNGGSGGHGS